MIEFYRQYILDQEEESAEDSEELNEKDKAAYEVKKNHCINQPRLISVQMFVDMFEAVGVNSSLSRRCDSHDD
jgi:hypothetical protein